jgi:hypothetical protein
MRERERKREEERRKEVQASWVNEVHNVKLRSE